MEILIFLFIVYYMIGDICTFKRAQLEQKKKEGKQ
jgi:hypothetical protein